MRPASGLLSDREAEAGPQVSGSVGSTPVAAPKETISVQPPVGPARIGGSAGGRWAKRRDGHDQKSGRGHDRRDRKGPARREAEVRQREASRLRRAGRWRVERPAESQATIASRPASADEAGGEEEAHGRLRAQADRPKAAVRIGRGAGRRPRRHPRATACRRPSPGSPDPRSSSAAAAAAGPPGRPADGRAARSPDGRHSARHERMPERVDGRMNGPGRAASTWLVQARPSRQSSARGPERAQQRSRAGPPTAAAMPPTVTRAPRQPCAAGNRPPRRMPRSLAPGRHQQAEEQPGQQQAGDHDKTRQREEQAAKRRRASRAAQGLGPQRHDPQPERLGIDRRRQIGRPTRLGGHLVSAAAARRWSVQSGRPPAGGRWPARRRPWASGRSPSSSGRPGRAAASSGPAPASNGKGGSQSAIESSSVIPSTSGTTPRAVAAPSHRGDPGDRQVGGGLDHLAVDRLGLEERSRSRSPTATGRPWAARSSAIQRSMMISPSAGTGSGHPQHRRDHRRAGWWRRCPATVE